MQYFSRCSDKYTEIKMCKEPFSKIQSQIVFLINIPVKIRRLLCVKVQYILKAMLQVCKFSEFYFADLMSIKFSNSAVTNYC